MNDSQDVAAVGLPRARHAGGADRYEIARSLLEHLPPSQRDTAEVAVNRARLLVLTGHPRDAVALLAEYGIGTLPDVLNWPHVVLAAAQAATGNRQAYLRLLHATGSTVLEERQLTALRGTVAERLGDCGTADRCWVSLVNVHGIRSQHALARLAVAQVAMRDAADADAAARDVLTAATHFDLIQPPLTTDPGPVLDAAALLHRRGDVAGARLLLEAVSLRHKPIQPVRDALHALTPGSEQARYRWRLAGYLVLTYLVVVGALVATLLLGLTPALAWLGWLVLVAMRRYWTRRTLVPGFTLADSRVWRSVHSLRFLNGKGAVEGKDQRGWFALLGGIAGIATTALAYSWLSHRAGVHNIGDLDHPALAQDLVMCAAYAAAVGAFFAARRARRWRIERRVARAALRSASPAG